MRSEEIDGALEDRSIPFLMHRIVGRVEALVNRWARPLGLRIEGVRVLFRLLAGDRTAGELARLTGVELSTLSRLLGRMSDMGLVTRRRDPDDARSVIVSLTPAGRRLAVEHQPVYFRDYEAVLLDGMSGDEARRLRAQLKRMLDNLDRADADAKPGPDARRSAAEA